MKLHIINLENVQSGDKELPLQCREAYRPNIIKRAVHALQSSARQAYGAHPEAGKRHSSNISKRRRKYRGCYGFGISRVDRKILSRRGTRFYWVGATSPQTRGGRRSHPPKASKQFDQKINKKENRKAICSALTATLNRTMVLERGHSVPETYPFIITSDFENLTKTKEVKTVLQTLGFKDELKRSLLKKVRAGLGTMRGRRYQRKKGILLVVSDTCSLQKSASNLAGIDIVPVSSLNAEVLAPGAMPGRVTLMTEKAVDVLTEKKLFM
ncbi:50S ribosomal protein L4 [Candidatus Woesearchaeota archaeon]|jgi:large subunit ribosomal protein L4e|nr:50S ribosomal protein L4 [Candidatus Woesearchaeota archaeon]MBT5397341.1 50S ribosomal protein L4 [Candidatus Woesearchaeota archaeon]MBT5924399.1 50S ribosomal protein L4 [Candidatus Woesearchaeota archaeon]MBT6367814.1 50S ribosomal protein L4 [Candidatus Woesearchaeota archaeon]MBT7762741.1 50S ribosomal protein L4 [Candidatus Woesearchaeota archaeon]